MRAGGGELSGERDRVAFASRCSALSRLRPVVNNERKRPPVNPLNQVRILGVHLMIAFLSLSSPRSAGPGRRQGPYRGYGYSFTKGYFIPTSGKDCYQRE